MLHPLPQLPSSVVCYRRSSTSRSCTSNVRELSSTSLSIWLPSSPSIVVWLYYAIDPIITSVHLIAISATIAFTATSALVHHVVTDYAAASAIRALPAALRVLLPPQSTAADAESATMA